MHSANIQEKQEESFIFLKLAFTFVNSRCIHIPITQFCIIYFPKISRCVGKNNHPAIHPTTLLCATSLSSSENCRSRYHSKTQTHSFKPKPSSQWKRSLPKSRPSLPEPTTSPSNSSPQKPQWVARTSAPVSTVCPAPCARCL